MSDVELKDDGLRQILKALKKEKLTARVGILGKTSGRDGDGPNNATVGAAHEFGTSILPRRSFLREPLNDLLNKRLQQSGAFDKDALGDVLEKGTLRPWLEKVAVIAEGIVLEAFDTSGFGKWRPSNFYRKKVHQTLVETQQLRDSITSEVKDA